jgi:hypothetical protein
MQPVGLLIADVLKGARAELPALGLPTSPAGVQTLTQLDLPGLRLPQRQRDETASAARRIALRTRISKILRSSV